MVEDVCIECIVDLCASAPLDTVRWPYSAIFFERAVVGRVGVAYIEDIELRVDIHILYGGFHSLLSTLAGE